MKISLLSDVFDVLGEDDLLFCGSSAQVSSREINKQYCVIM